MKILAIETSCDDTGIAILDIRKLQNSTKFKILANKVHTQLIHTNYGGVFPMMAKREHGKNIIPTISAALEEAKLYKKEQSEISKNLQEKIKGVLSRENDLGTICLDFLLQTKKPNIDAIAVTVGPGLEPALWVGISTARALALAWDIPIIPVNHMEGHVLSVLVNKNKVFTYTKKTLQFPVLSLLVSGGHTEIVLMKEFGKYKVVGQTRDDAAGEAFDKVARMLGLPYPGGPEISKLAEAERISVNSENNFARSGEKVRGPGKLLSELKEVTLPRPMIYTKDFDFSFSGLKTAVLYYIRDNRPLTEKMKSGIAKEFEDAVVDVLSTKTMNAIEKYGAKTLIIGGGVSANTQLQKVLKKKIKKVDASMAIHFPTRALSTDNALMIAIAGYFQHQNKKFSKTNKNLKATGNLSL